MLRLLRIVGLGSTSCNVARDNNKTCVASCHPVAPRNSSATCNVTVAVNIAQCNRILGVWWSSPHVTFRRLRCWISQNARRDVPPGRTPCSKSNASSIWRLRAVPRLRCGAAAGARAAGRPSTAQAQCHCWPSWSDRTERSCWSQWWA